MPSPEGRVWFGMTSCRAELHLVVQTGTNEVPGCFVVPSCGQRRDEFRHVRQSIP